MIEGARPNEAELEYVGFWPRVWAGIIDAVLMSLITVPILLSVYGPTYFSSGSFLAGPLDFLVSWVFPGIAVVLFWVFKQATPGKMAVAARIVDATTGGKPSAGQFVGRYLAYFVSILPVFLGLVWVAFDKRKQGWHDKLAGTVVIRPARHGPEAVRFMTTSK